MANSDRQRLDKWLWHARMARTRTAAAELISQGHVRVNSRRVEQVAKPVACGDVLTIAFHNRVVVLEVLGIAERRGPFTEASQLYRLIEGAIAPAQGEKESEGPN
jgi:ribosome-associated heat shock protein Hsp15